MHKADEILNVDVAVFFRCHVEYWQQKILSNYHVIVFNIFIIANNHLYDIDKGRVWPGSHQTERIISLLIDYKYLLYLPSELRSSSISAWWSSSSVSIDLGWILGEKSSPVHISWNWNTSSSTRSDHWSSILTLDWVCAQECPRSISPPGSRDEWGL